MLRDRPPGKGRISTTPFTWAPSQTSRRAMISPMSPEPRMTTSRPGRYPSMFTKRCARPAVMIPAGRVPGMSRLPRLRSRQPMASTTARQSTCATPSGSCSSTTVLDGPRSRMSITMAPVRMATPASSAIAR